MFSSGKIFSELYPGCFPRWGSFSGAFYIPGIREFMLLNGVMDASRSSLARAAKRKESIILLPGGIQEMGLTDGHSKTTSIVLAERKGFVRLSVEYGLDVVPSFTFGEKYIHDTVQLPAVVARWLHRNLKVSGTLLRGRFGVTFLGYSRRPLHHVWGAPILVTRIDPKADPEGFARETDRVHALCVEAVTGLFDRHKTRFGYAADEVLEVISPKSVRDKKGQ